MADHTTSQSSELQQALEQAAGPLDDYLEPDIHAADYGPEDSEAVEPEEFPPPPTGAELTGFVADLDGATDWPATPPQPGKDTPWDMRPVAARQLQAGDVLHDQEHAVEVVEVCESIIPLLCRRDGWQFEFTVHAPASQTFLASRPAGWDGPTPDAEPDRWRQLVADYRQALEAYDQTPMNGPLIVAAANRRDRARLALFGHLDATGKEAT